MAIKRNDDGQRWFVPLMHRPKRRGPLLDETCPEHPLKRMSRVLNGSWVCLDCVREKATPQQ